jgi:alkylation response protein AidB-like acyl-CoA dehydrogenase
MDLDISTSEIRRGLREYLADHDSLAEVRAAADAAPAARARPPFDPDVWLGLAQGLGVTGLAVPARYGGLALGLQAVTAALHEAGHELYPGPLLATVSAAAALVAALADGSAGPAVASTRADGSVRPAVASALTAIAAGRAVATLAVPAGDVQGGCGATVDGSVLRGTARVVPYGACADLLVAVASAPGRAVLVLVGAADLAKAGRLVRPGVDFSRAYADVALDGIRGDVICADPGAVSRALDIAQVLTAADQVGMAAGALDRTLEYLRVREQFGRVIGTYQALQHRCADLAVDIEAAAALVAMAAAAGDAGDAGLLARTGLLARAAASEASVFAADTMIQLHGGLGFTWEHDAHLFFRRARSMAAWFGTVRQLRAEAARRDCFGLIAR